MVLQRLLTHWLAGQPFKAPLSCSALLLGLLGVAVLLLSVSKRALSHHHPIQPSHINLRPVYLVKHRLNLLWTL